LPKFHGFVEFSLAKGKNFYLPAPDASGSGRRYLCFLLNKLPKF